MSKSSSIKSQPACQPTIAKQDPGIVDALALKKAQTTIPAEGKSAADCARLSAELAQTWLAWQCRMVAGIIRGAIYLPADLERQGTAISIWPGEGEGDPELFDVAVQALEENRNVVHSQQHYGPENSRACDLLACSLIADHQVVAVVALMITPRSEPQQHAVLQLLQWGGLWMETLVAQQNDAKQQDGTFALAAMTTILGHTSCHAAAIETVNQLADQFGCERVSLGFRQGLPIRLQALSHVARFDPRTQLVRSIEAAMEEAVDQHITIIQPGEPDQASAVTRAHAELAGLQGNNAVCTIPLPGRTGAIGAITLERGAGQPFEKNTLKLCESLARVIGPALELQQREERAFWTKGVERLGELAAGIFGTAQLKLKLALLAAIVLVSALAFIDGNYRVTAPASIEGAVRQMLVAPQNGHVKQAEVRAGDLVKQGQLIATLDDRNLQLERDKWQGQRNKIEKEYQEALAKRERARLSILRAQLDQVDAELQLIEEKLIRTRLLAPFDGIVVSGDLSQSLGAPVEIGQLLYEVAPLSRYRVVLEVDDRDVAGLEQGKTGQLIIAALPRTSFAIAVEQVVPVAVSSDARNFFRVEASLDEATTLLRPGMRGVAKVDMGPRSLLWICTHSVIDRIRLWAWSAGW